MIPYGGTLVNVVVGVLFEAGSYCRTQDGLRLPAFCFSLHVLRVRARAATHGLGTMWVLYLFEAGSDLFMPLSYGSRYQECSTREDGKQFKNRL